MDDAAALDDGAHVESASMGMPDRVPALAGRRKSSHATQPANTDA